MFERSIDVAEFLTDIQYNNMADQRQNKKQANRGKTKTICERKKLQAIVIHLEHS